MLDGRQERESAFLCFLNGHPLADFRLALADGHQLHPFNSVFGRKAWCSTGGDMRSRMREVLSVCMYALPLAHPCACIVISIANIESGWKQMIKIDFPFSVVLVGLVYAKDWPLLWFGVL